MPPGPPRSGRTTDAVASGSQPLRALVVEDEPPIRAALVRVLGEMSFAAVDHLGSGSRAIDAVRGSDYDIALLDLGLPDMNGHDVLGELKRLRPDMKVIVVTGSTDVEDAVTSLDLDADDHITKPIQTEDVQARVRKALRTTTKPQTSRFRGASLESADGVFSLDLRMMTTRVNGELKQLTPSQFAILRHLVANPGQIFSHRELTMIPGASLRSKQVVTECVRRLRTEVDPDKQYIHTRHGLGYFFFPPES